jgi:hypothetical protein
MPDVHPASRPPCLPAPRPRNRLARLIPAVTSRSCPSVESRPSRADPGGADRRHDADHEHGEEAESATRVETIAAFTRRGVASTSWFGR